MILNFSIRIPRQRAIGRLNSVAHKWRHDSDKTQTNKLEWWMILKISLRAKGGVPKTLLEQKHRLKISCISLKTRSCWPSLARNSVICILFLDFVRFAIPRQGASCYVIFFIWCVNTCICCFVVGIVLFHRGNLWHFQKPLFHFTFI